MPTWPTDPTPFLATAYCRIARADHHLKDLHIKIAELWKDRGGPTKVGFTYNVNARELSLKEPIDFSSVPAIPLTFGILVGELVYNLRSALDYLVFDLALFRRGTEQKGTQFPIEDSEDGWRRHIIDGIYLTGLLDDDIAAIKRCQPCKGVGFGGERFAWLGRLRDISNGDKHRQWTVVAHTIQAGVEVRIGARGSFDGMPGQVQGAVTADGREIDVHMKGDLIRAEVTFEDGSPVVKTLDEFVVKTKELVDLFQLEFQGQAACLVDANAANPS